MSVQTLVALCSLTEIVKLFWTLYSLISVEYDVQTGSKFCKNIFWKTNENECFAAKHENMYSTKKTRKIQSVVSTSCPTRISLTHLTTRLFLVWALFTQQTGRVFSLRGEKKKKKFFSRDKGCGFYMKNFHCALRAPATL